MRRRAFRTAQPDIVQVGGLREAKKCESAGVGIAPHNPLGPIAGIAALQFGLSTPNHVIQTEMVGAVPWYDDVVQRPIERTPGCWRQRRAGHDHSISAHAGADQTFRPPVRGGPRRPRPALRRCALR
ncbi:hypothetical protein LCL92_14855 [Salipiger thiooxidans]|nr:hypothetical protein [Salipiger thiooxidans]